MKNEHLIRQSDLIPESVLTKKINIIGAGAIGSFTTLALAKMGFTNIVVFDYDTVSVENMSCQFYRFADIGKSKVEALYDLVKDFTNVEIIAINERWNETPLDGVIICAADSMDTRDRISVVHKSKAKSDIVIDSRMMAELALLYTYIPTSSTDQDNYRNTLHTDEDSVQEKCTAKSTMYTACMLSGLVACAVKKFLVSGIYSKQLTWDIVKNDMINFNAESHDEKIPF